LRLLDHFSRSGDFCFRWRSYLPLLLLPVFLLGVADAAGRPAPGAWGRVWQAGCFLISLAGLAIRVITIGTAPAGTSERSTRDPRASVLNTAGAYSVVRHPLYLGNSLVALGLACLPGVWYLPVIVALASLLYHERIAAREERFLEERFGDEFRRWADTVSAMVPAPGRYRPPATPFRWRRVLGREFHALFVIGAGFFVLDLGRRFAATGRVSVDPIWTAVAVATALVFIVMTAVKKTTRLLRAD
jgi:protein-S-isoprenylcysteine O-methyltransferase Ste14